MRSRCVSRGGGKNRGELLVGRELPRQLAQTPFGHLRKVGKIRPNGVITLEALHGVNDRLI